MKHVQQPTRSTCGQACVAMVLGISITEAIALVGHTRASRNHQIAAAVGLRSKRFRRISAVAGGDLWARTNRSILRTRFGKTTRHHLVVLYGTRLFDPGLSDSMMVDDWLDWAREKGWRVVSYLPLDADRRLADAGMRRAE